MGFKHLHEANPFKKKFLIKVAIYYSILTLVSCYITFGIDSEDTYDFVYMGVEYKIIVREGENPIDNAKSRVHFLTPGVEPIITEKDLIKRSKFSFFLKMQWAWFLIIIAWIIARFFNRLLYGDDPDIKLNEDIRLFDRLFKSKKWGLNPHNSEEHKYTYINYGEQKEDIRDIYSDEGTLIRAEVFSEEHYPNGKLKQINLRKTGINFKKRYGKSELRFQRIKDDENTGMIEIIKTFYENGKKATKSEFFFDEKSNSFKRVSIWTEWNECNENGPPSKKISIEFKAEMIDKFYENGIWYDVIDKINLRPKFKNVIDKAPLLKNIIDKKTPRLKKIKQQAKKNGSEEFKHQINQFINEMKKIPDWYEIVQKRGNGHAMFAKSMNIKVDDYEYWANAHLEEYMLKYNDGDLDVEGINLRIEKFGFIVSELEKVIKKAAELNFNITHEMHNDYCAARASLLGAEYALKEMTK